MKSGLTIANVALFFTAGGSISRWKEMGSLERELFLYREIAQRSGIGIHLFTYGGARDTQLASEAAPLHVHSVTAGGVPPSDLSAMIIRQYGHVLTQLDLIKTNQLKGADIALDIAQHYSKPCLVRTGYLPSRHPKPGDEVTIYALESACFVRAAAVAVATPMDCHYVSESYRVPRDRIAVVPNYVETRRFCPGEETRPTDLIYVGRGSKEKNLPLLFDAIEILSRRGQSLTVQFVGACAEKGELVDNARRRKLPINWLGPATHDVLPSLLRQAKVFVLPSLYEGHPKALIEAMACECAVIGTDVEGIREIVTPGITGVLSANDPAALAEHISALVSDGPRRSMLGRAARLAVQEQFDFERILELEMALYRKLTQPP